MTDSEKAATIIDLAMISLLVDKGLLTPDEIIVRVERLYSKMDQLHGSGVLARLELWLMELRARPGSTQ